MKKLIGIVYLLATIGALIVFHLRISGRDWIDLLIGIPHWPLWLMQKAIGSNILQWNYEFCDWLLSKLGYHPYATSLLILFLSLSFASSLKEEKGGWWSYLAFVPMAALVSGLVSGMYLQRGYLGYSTTHDAEGFARYFDDLMFGAKIPDLNAPRYAVVRLYKITGDSLLAEKILTKDPQLAEKAELIEKNIFEIRKRISETPSSAGLKEPGNLFFAFELAMRLKKNFYLIRAENGQGGDPEQPWRDFVAMGPTGPIRFKTNLRLPEPGSLDGVPLLRYFENHSAAGQIREGIPHSYRDEMDFYNQVIDSLGTAESRSSDLIRMWYTTLTTYFHVQRILAEQFPSLIAEDSVKREGGKELVVFFHNSKTSYKRLDSLPEDIAGAGSYIPESNEVHIWVSERENDMAHANYLLAKLAIESGSRSLVGDYEVLNRMINSIAPKMRMKVLEHEISHWALTMQLGGMSKTLDGLPFAIVEGPALLVDSHKSKNLGMASRKPDLSSYLGSRITDHWSFKKGGNSLFCDWMLAQNHDSRSPADLVLFDREKFYQSNTEQNYADAWALATFFSSRIYDRASANNQSLVDFIRSDNGLSKPWESQKAMMESEPGKPGNPLGREIKSCRDQRSFDERIELLSTHK